MGDVSRARVVVGGMVQGVFFRARTRDFAASLLLSGWVRNLPDGTVEAVFEGPRAEVERAVAWCGVGPPHATVESLDVMWEEPSREQGFSVRY